MATKKVLDSAIQGLIKRLEKTETFVVAQAPEICKQMIAEKVLDHKTSLLVHGPFSIVFPFITYFLANKTFSTENGVAALCGLSAGLLGVWSLVAITNVIGSVQYLIFLKKCPKLFLLREFKKLIK
jgi:hypothetical protein